MKRFETLNQMKKKKKSIFNLLYIYIYIVDTHKYAFFFLIFFLEVGRFIASIA